MTGLAGTGATVFPADHVVHDLNSTTQGTTTEDVVCPGSSSPYRAN